MKKTNNTTILIVRNSLLRALDKIFESIQVGTSLKMIWQRKQILSIKLS